MVTKNDSDFTALRFLSRVMIFVCNSEWHPFCHQKYMYFIIKISLELHEKSPWKKYKVALKSALNCFNSVRILIFFKFSLLICLDPALNLNLNYM